MKKCSTCKVEKPLDAFGKHKSHKDGLQYTCKACYKTYRAKNREQAAEYLRKYQELNREQITEQRKRYREANKELISEQNKKWREENKERIIKYFKKRYEVKREDPQFRFERSLRGRTNAAFKAKGWSVPLSTEEIIGDSETVFKHIESRFKNGMSWSNYGEWTVDHIVPLASAENDIELIELCCYTNTQPLWRKENETKANKIIACRVEYKHEIVEL